MAAPISPASLAAKPIAFGTDGWRGVIAADFTFERVVRVAPLAALALAQTYGDTINSRTIIVGYDRRFLSEEFAKAAADAVSAAGFEVFLSETYAPTPAFSWAAKQQNALGALVITASHNPGMYSGLKVKGGFGGSVPPEVTQKIEAMLQSDQTVESRLESKVTAIQTFDPWQSYCDGLRTKVDIAAIQAAIASGQLTVFADVMHGAAATGLARLLGDGIRELNSNRDPLFEGGAPEPLPRYLGSMFDTIKTYRQQSASDLVVGLVFDGDSDRVAAVDGQGNFLSSQILIPILIEHLAVHRGYSGEVIKTISGSNLIPKVAEFYDLPVYQTPIGYKYIADRMLEAQVLLGGEESGGIPQHAKWPADGAAADVQSPKRRSAAPKRAVPQRLVLPSRRWRAARCECSLHYLLRERHEPRLAYAGLRQTGRLRHRVDRPGRRTDANHRHVVGGNFGSARDVSGFTSAALAPLGRGPTRVDPGRGESERQRIRRGFAGPARLGPDRIGHHSAHHRLVDRHPEHHPMAAHALDGASAAMKMWFAVHCTYACVAASVAALGLSEAPEALAQPSPARWMTLPSPPPTGESTPTYLKGMTNRGPKLWVLRRPVGGVAEFRGDHWTIHPLPLDIVPGETISGQHRLDSRDSDVFDFGRGHQLTLNAASIVAPPATCWQSLRRTTVQFDGVQWRSVPGGSTCVAYPSTPGPMPLDHRVLGLIGAPAGRRPGVGVFDDGTWRLIAWTPQETVPITQLAFVRSSFTLDGGTTTYTIGPMGNVNGGPRITGVLQWDGNTGWTSVDPAFINPAGQAGGPIHYAVYDDGRGPALYTNHRPEPYSSLGHPLSNSIFRWRLGEGWTVKRWL
ncbi:hypothetical protein [Leptolyngbya sp. 7M]|uniref:hypothetical protein n=1 Tax=Leptolyngbya sp. 7M TaxID=2812896 RepID=UPI001B8BB31C|nr:hypothetical protein [Leptolyngbya sp. 7M]QYO63922.1 hypothetical protein JVX88_29620 [Leptolyngbya sp. 7M]